MTQAKKKAVNNNDNLIFSVGNHTRTVHRPQLPSFWPNLAPTLRRFQPHKPYWHLRQPIKIDVSTAANHNVAATHQRQDLQGKVGWAAHVYRCRNCAVPLRSPSRSYVEEKACALWLPRREEALLDATARLEVIWITGSADVITSLITQVLFWLIPLNTSVGGWCPLLLWVKQTEMNSTS